MDAPNGTSRSEFNYEWVKQLVTHSLTYLLTYLPSIEKKLVIYEDPTVIAKMAEQKVVKSKPIYVFLYGTYGIKRIMKCVEKNKISYGLIRGHGRVFVGSKYMPSLQRMNYYEVYIRVPD